MTTDIKTRLRNTQGIELTNAAVEAADQIEDLEQALAEASKDAERYRGIRAASCEFGSSHDDDYDDNAFIAAMESVIGDNIPTPDLYDAAIDAGLKAIKENQHEQ